MKSEEQQAFLQMVKLHLPKHYTFVEELAELLQISQDSAYRRIRGETALTFEEIIRVCQKYKVSFDAFGNISSQQVGFHYFALNTEKEFQQYLESFEQTLSKLRYIPNFELIYGADDLPVFHHFRHREHSAFKMLFWIKSLVQNSDILEKKFSVEAINPELIDLGTRLYENYIKIPSIEIWTEDSANSTLKQIEYIWDLGLFAEEKQAILICEQFLEILEQIQKQTENESKSNNVSFQMYESETGIGNNCVLLKSAQQSMVFLGYQTFNSITTTNPSFCQETERFLRSLMRKSILISGISERQRYQFFRKIRKKTEKLLDKIVTE